VTEQTETQAEIKAWWETNPMPYAWRNKNQYREGTPEWFAEGDHVLFDRVSSFFANTKGDKPFSDLIPYRDLRGKEVLEVGCGWGAHARLMSEAGAHLTAIDLTENAVALTQARLALAGLTATIVQLDALRLSFAPESFDFVWSWGVIHHSEGTEQIVREMARVLRPGGEARVMVYHRRSIEVLMLLTLGALTGRLFRDGVGGDPQPLFGRVHCQILHTKAACRPVSALFQASSNKGVRPEGRVGPIALQRGSRQVEEGHRLSHPRVHRCPDPVQMGRNVVPDGKEVNFAVH